MFKISWFKVDDQLAFNAKVMLAGNSAMGLWVRAGSWSSAQLTGGFIPAHMANAMANAMANPCDADALVMAGLWDEAEGGYQFHDWTDFQPDAEAEKEKRKATSKARSDAGKAGAAARWNRENNGKPDGKANGKPIANVKQNDAPVPSRPDPSSPSLFPVPDIAEDTEPKGKRTPEHPLPNSWQPTPAHEQKAKEKNLDVKFLAEAFRNHADAHERRARNWNAAFSNWILKATPGSAPAAGNVPAQYGWANR